MDNSVGRKLIAERAGVSKRTVSRVLQGDGSVSEKTKKRVLEVVDELGYTRNKLASNLSQNKNSNFVAVLVPDMTNYYYLEIFDCLTRFFEDSDYIVSIYRITQSNLFKTYDTMLENRVSVIINLGFFPITEEYLKKVKSANIRIIHPGIGEDSVPIQINYLHAMDDAFQALTKKGCRNIKFICGAGKQFSEDKRIQAFLYLLDKYSLPKNEDSIVWGDYPEVESMEVGRRSIVEILDHGGADALFCLTDMMAFGAIGTLLEMGKIVGKDVSVIGFDNTLMGKFCVPQLSTIDSAIQTEIQRYIDYILGNEVDDTEIEAAFIQGKSSV